MRLIEEEGLDVDDLLAEMRLEDDGGETVPNNNEGETDEMQRRQDERESETRATTAKEKKKKKRRASKEKNGPEGNVKENRCGGCGEAFGSRTKLFAHLRAFPGHATLRR